MQGDPELQATLGALASKHTRAVAAAVIDTATAPETRFAFIGAAADTRFEIGSVTKPLVGMLLAECVALDEISLDTNIGAIYPDHPGTEFWAVLVRELSTHTSGLPRLPRGVLIRAHEVAMGLLARDPYRASTPEQMMRLAARQSLHTHGAYCYSNLGAAVLGELLAITAGKEFAPLLHDRILAPLGMEATAVGNRNTSAPGGYSARGRREQPWLMGAYAPAGAVVSTIADMSRLAVALLAGTAPGRDSLDPLIADTGAWHRRSGMFWVIDSVPSTGRSMIWHNGQTGGYSAFFALFPEASRAVVVLANVALASEPERIGLGLVKSIAAP